MPTVKSCCCGCSLRTGTLILLWLGAIPHSLSFAIGILAGVVHNAPFSTILANALFTGTFISIYVGGIYGVVKKRPSFLIPYLGVQVFAMVMVIIGIAALPNLEGSSKRTDRPSGIIISFLFIEAIIYYFFVVVLSYYKQLKEEKETFQC